MAVCLNYQNVYYKREKVASSVRWQVAAGVLLVFALAAKVWLKIETTDVGYQLARERQRTIELDMRRRELELELSVLMRPDNLAREAARRIGLGMLSPNQARKVSISTYGVDRP